MNRAKELDEKSMVSESDQLEKLKIETENPAVLVASTNPVDELSENIKILVTELKSLGCDIDFQYTESGLVAYNVTTPSKKHHSGLATEWELAQILAEVV